jgi:hypothetical protein
LDATLVDKARNLPHRDGQPHQRGEDKIIFRGTFFRIKIALKWFSRLRRNKDPRATPAPAPLQPIRRSHSDSRCSFETLAPTLSRVVLEEKKNSSTRQTI